MSEQFWSAPEKGVNPYAKDLLPVPESFTSCKYMSQKLFDNCLIHVWWCFDTCLVMVRCIVLDIYTVATDEIYVWIRFMSCGYMVHVQIHNSCSIHIRIQSISCTRCCHKRHTRCVVLTSYIYVKCMHTSMQKDTTICYTSRYIAIMFSKTDAEYN